MQWFTQWLKFFKVKEHKKNKESANTAPIPETDPLQLSPAAIRKRQLICLACFLLGGAVLLWLLLGNTQTSEPEPEQLSQVNFTAPVESPAVMMQALRAIQTQLKSSDAQTNLITEQLAGLENLQQDLSTQISATQTELSEFQQNVRRQQSESALNTPPPADIEAPPLSVSSSAFSSPALLKQAPIQTIDIALRQSDPEPITATIANTIPPGSFVQAVMLNGLDADTSVGGQGNPKPVLMRVTGWGNLPNGFYSQLKDCVVVGAGIGDISSERAYIRLDTLSCVLNDGDILETSVFGHVVDHSDGKVGVKGTLRLGEGHLVRNAFFSGLVSGVGRSVSQQSMTSLYTPIGQTSMIDPSRTLQYGLGSGVGESGDRMADYFIRRADQYSPVIEVPPQAVDIIFIKEAVALDPAFDGTRKGSQSVRPAELAEPNNNTSLQAEMAEVKQLFNSYPTRGTM